MHVTRFAPSSLRPRSLPLRTLALAGVSAFLAGGLTACKNDAAPAPIVTNNGAQNPGDPNAQYANGSDPAAANMAGAPGQPTRVLGQNQSYTPQQQGEYPAGQQPPAPIVQGYNNNSASNDAYSTAQNYSGAPQNNAQPYSGQANYNQGYADGEAADAASAPPPLPVYDQPPAPDPNDIWTPGYWNYAHTGYYWVPGSWVAAPYYGALWTPPYWGYERSRYRFHRGYWGQHIGYYGGINYGWGYIGTGYYGGYWRGHDFYYNRAVNRLSPGVRTVYERPVVINNVHYDYHPSTRISYNGGPGGVDYRPHPYEVAAERERHQAPLPAQVALREQAAGNRGNFFAQNQGRPTQVAFAHPPAASAPLPANNPAGNIGQPFNHPGGAPGNSERPGFNRAGGNPGGNEGFHRPGEPGTPGTQPQPYNRPAPGAPAPIVAGHGNGNPAAPVPNAPVNRPGPVERSGFNHPGVAPGTNPGIPTQGAIVPSHEDGMRPGPNGPVHTGGPDHPGFNRPGSPNQPLITPAQPPVNPNVNRPITPTGNPGGRPFEPGQRPGEPNGRFNNPNATRPPSAPAAAPTPAAPVNQPHVNQPGGNPGFNRPVPLSRSPENAQPNPGFNRPAPVAQPRVEMQRPAAVAPAPHIEAPRPAPHFEAPRPAPPATPAPHIEAPHPAPAPRAEAAHPGPPEGSGHPR